LVMAQQARFRSSQGLSFVRDLGTSSCHHQNRDDAALGGLYIGSCALLLNGRSSPLLQTLPHLKMADNLWESFNTPKPIPLVATLSTRP
jgi:hypothetical protein